MLACARGNRNADSREGDLGYTEHDISVSLLRGLQSWMFERVDNFVAHFRNLCGT